MSESTDKRLRAAVDRFVDELRAVLEESHRERIQSVIEQLGGVAPAPRASSKAEAKAGSPKCGACGKHGHNARTCKAKPTASKLVRRPTSTPIEVVEVLEIAAAEIATPPSPPPPLLEPAVSPPSKRRPNGGASSATVPDGWNAEDDRREEMADLSWLTLMRK